MSYPIFLVKDRQYIEGQITLEDISMFELMGSKQFLVKGKGMNSTFHPNILELGKLHSWIRKVRQGKHMMSWQHSIRFLVQDKHNCLVFDPSILVLDIKYNFLHIFQLDINIVEMWDSMHSLVMGKHICFGLNPRILELDMLHNWHQKYLEDSYKLYLQHPIMF